MKILRPLRIKGGLRIGRDGRIHPEYTHNPSTLRLACQNPNMQNLPRAGGTEDLETIVRNLIVAGDGMTLIERDFSAIEAVLVGYYARSPEYIRLSKLGIHAYLASHVLGRPADLSWSDADLKGYFKEIKSSRDTTIQTIYTGSKRAVHLSAYGGTPTKMHRSEPDVFPTVKNAAWLQDIYLELCPYIRTWQMETQLEAHRNGFLRNNFDYVHRFTHVFRNVKENGKWVKKPGDQANETLAFRPQSTAAGIIKEAMLVAYFERFEEIGRWLRLQVHDSLVSETPVKEAERADAALKEIMEAPVGVLTLPASYGMGSCLSIETDGKRGQRWGMLH